jgi:hypothetical protein
MLPFPVSSISPTGRAVDTGGGALDAQRSELRFQMEEIDRRYEALKAQEYRKLLERFCDGVVPVSAITDGGRLPVAGSSHRPASPGPTHQQPAAPVARNDVGRERHERSVSVQYGLDWKLTCRVAHAERQHSPSTRTTTTLHPTGFSSVSLPSSALTTPPTTAPRFSVQWELAIGIWSGGRMLAPE